MKTGFDYLIDALLDVGFIGLVAYVCIRLGREKKL